MSRCSLIVIAEHSCYSVTSAAAEESRSKFVSRPPTTQTAFGLRLSDRGFTKDRPTNGPHRAKIVYRGIGLDDTVGERLGQVTVLGEEGEEFCPF